MKALSNEALNTLVLLVENAPGRPVDLDPRGLRELDEQGATTRVAYNGEFPRVAANAAGVLLYIQYFGTGVWTLEAAVKRRLQLAPKHTLPESERNLRLV